MSRYELYVIEARSKDGKLDLAEPQPERVFGSGAIQGLTTDEMARVIFRHIPDAVLDGRFVVDWPRVLDARWVARRKTW